MPDDSGEAEEAEVVVQEEEVPETEAAESSSTSAASRKSGSGSKSSSKSASASSSSSARAAAISVTVTFDSSNAAAYNSKFPSSLGTFAVELTEGATVYDALVATGVEFTATGGNYISSIGGIAEKACGAGSGWMYSVDGKFPSKSAMKCELADGAQVRWAYTVTMGDM